MTWRQLLAWRDYAEIEPFGEERADLRSGIVASVVANANRDPKRRPKPYQPSDFMPFINGPKDRRPLTDPGRWAQVKSQAKAMADKERE